MYPRPLAEWFFNIARDGHLSGTYLPAQNELFALALGVKPGVPISETTVLRFETTQKMVYPGCFDAAAVPVKISRQHYVTHLRLL